MELDDIKELVRIFGKSKLDKIQIKMKDFEIEMEKGGTPAPAASQTVSVPAAQAAAAPAPLQTELAVPAEESAEKISGDVISSPMVGTFYAAPSPDSPPFVKVGDTVKKGQTLCILEAMKIMNELEAEFDCKIVDILVQDGEAVEYDKPLFVVEKL